MRNQLPLLLAVVAVAALAPRTAGAQVSFDTEMFKASPHGDSFVTTESGAIAPSLEARAQVYFIYSHKPLQLLDANGNSLSSLDHRLAMQLGAAISLFDRLSIGLVVPMTLFQTGNISIAGVPQLANVAFGDLRLEPKLGLLNQAKHFIDLALTFGVSFPTGGRSTFSGDRSVTVNGEVDVSRKLGGFLRLGLNLGFWWRNKSFYYNLVVGPEIYYRAAVGLDLGHFIEKVPVELFFELNGRFAAEPRNINLATSPLEGILAARYSPLKWLQLTGGVGRALTAGYGAPAFRAFVGLTFIPLAPKPAAEPEPPLPASEPASAATEPAVSAPPADSDGDGIIDAEDKCPEAAEDKDGFNDDDGCPDLDNDDDGIPDSADACPGIAEDKDGYQDEDGCPEVDNDGDGIADADDKCPLEPETINNVDDTDGCPDKGASLVVVTKEAIQILDKVQFASGKDVVLPTSFPLLDQVAATLKNHKEISLLRIEGHTDSDGPDAANLSLSQRRADAVRDYLIKQGVDSGRVKAVGYGETRPIAPNSSRRGKEQNRRVAFTIVDANTPDDAPAQPLQSAPVKKPAQEPALVPIAPKKADELPLVAPKK